MGSGTGGVGYRWVWLGRAGQGWGAWGRGVSPAWLRG